MNNKPIGVFDSGIGGLTVLKELFRVLPKESTLYLGDTARVPYGIRSAETVTRYSFENTGFLVSEGIKLLVVACNTVSAVSLEEIRKRVSMPVIGVIEPGSRAAAKTTRNRKVGVIGTEATIGSNAYTRIIKGFDDSIDVFGLPCPLFVPLVEEGLTEGEIAEIVAERYLKNVKDKGIDTLVLGCTHYPLLKNVIGKVMGSSIVLIDSAIETVREIRKTLLRDGIEADSAAEPSRLFYLTDAPERFRRVGERFLGQRIEKIAKIDIGGR
ncbi:MAG TPA: glutamate racemase [Thermodesulfovibrionales bacterium]|jgi:glutamate racemase|nr:glutamate racemase [Thermodesulfovibrionales bacterium]